MIDSKTVRALATARGMDPDTTGVVTFQVPQTHPRAVDGQVAAMLGTMNPHPLHGGISATGLVAFGDSEEAAAKALFGLIVTDAQAVEAKATADAAATTQARQAIEAAVAADETAAMESEAKP